MSTFWFSLRKCYSLTADGGDLLERRGYIGYMAMRQWDGGRGNTLMAWPGRLHSLFDVDEVAPKVVMPRAPWQRPL